MRIYLLNESDIDQYNKKNIPLTQVWLEPIQGIWISLTAPRIQMMLMPKVIGQVGTIVFWSMEVRALMEVIEYMMSITIDQIDITVENLDYVCRQFLLKVTIIISL